jgi:hypothetical protein
VYPPIKRLMKNFDSIAVPSFVAPGVFQSDELRLPLPPNQFGSDSAIDTYDQELCEGLAYLRILVRRRAVHRLLRDP